MGSLSTTDASERKTRGDSELDRLTPELQAEFFGFVETNTLAHAQEFLATEPLFKIVLSKQAISNWAAKKRKEAAEIKFQVWLADLGENARQARDITRAVTLAETETVTGDTPAEDRLASANVAILNASLTKALQTGAITDIKLFAKLSAMVGDTRAKQRSAAAALLSAETASKRFYFDAAKLALEHAAELQSINQTSGSQREKIERAVVRLFGTRPGMSKNDVNDGVSAPEEKTPVLDIKKQTLDKGVSDV